MDGLQAVKDFALRYERDRYNYVQDVLGVHPSTIEPFQKDVLLALDAGETRISMRSGHGVGKTCLDAWIVNHAQVCLYPLKAVCTANSASQLDDSLIPECKKWLNRLPPFLRAEFDYSTDRLWLKHDPAQSFTSFRTARPEKPEAIQGIHEKHVLLIADEASAIHESIFEAGRSSMSTPGAVMIMTSNPTRREGFFYKSQTEWSQENGGIWKTYHVSCFDSSRSDQAFIDEIEQDYGKDHPQYYIRVLGEFPPADQDVFIPFHLVDAAVGRDIEPDGPMLWGLDVARGGGDLSALAKRKGNVVTEPVMTWDLDDSMALVGRVQHEYESTPPEDRPDTIYVDAIGFGGPVADRLRGLDLPAVDINVSELPALKERYHRLRDEIWGNMLTWFRERKCSLPQDDKLVADLILPKLAPGDKIKVESKDKMARSPDRADALGLTFARDGGIAAGFKRSRNINKNLTDDWLV